MQLGATLKDVFGGQPGWLKAVPEGTVFDFSVGRVEGPGGALVRSPASGRWVFAISPAQLGPAEVRS